MKKIMWLFLALLSACSPSSLEDFRHEGESICKKLTEELRKIETQEQLLKEAPKIKVYFDQLASVMLAARRLEEESEETVQMIEKESVIGKALLGELRRIYTLEAGREVIEKAQKEALIKLSVRK